MGANTCRHPVVIIRRTRRRIALLVGGDAAALLAFAAVGRGSHAELDGIAGVLDTAWPFLLGALFRVGSI